MFWRRDHTEEDELRRDVAEARQEKERARLDMRRSADALNRALEEIEKGVTAIGCDIGRKDK